MHRSAVPARLIPNAPRCRSHDHLCRAQGADSLAPGMREPKTARQASRPKWRGVHADRLFQASAISAHSTLSPKQPGTAELSPGSQIGFLSLAGPWMRVIDTAAA